MATLALRADAFPDCVAFTTSGALKRDVRGQADWRRAGTGDPRSGLYVRSFLLPALMRDTTPEGAACHKLAPLPD